MPIRFFELRFWIPKISMRPCESTSEDLIEIPRKADLDELSLEASRFHEWKHLSKPHCPQDRLLLNPMSNVLAALVLHTEELPLVRFQLLF